MRLKRFIKFLSIAIATFLLGTAIAIVWESGTYTAAGNREAVSESLNELPSRAVEPSSEPNDEEASNEACSDNRPVTERYRNVNFGFSLLVPRGLSFDLDSTCFAGGQYGCTCTANHGGKIDIAEHSQILAFAYYQMDPDWTLGHYQKEHISFLTARENVKGVRVLGSTGASIGHVRARRTIVQYFEDGRNSIHIYCVALHNDIVLELSLSTTSERYPQDIKLFDRVLASGRWIPQEDN